MHPNTLIRGGREKLYIKGGLKNEVEYSNLHDEEHTQDPPVQQSTERIVPLLNHKDKITDVSPDWIY